MFSLLNPIFLWAATATAVPMILHMIQSSRTVRMPFSTIRFLKLAEKKSSRRIKMENFLLWLLRTLIMLLIALAFTMPMFRTENFGNFLKGARRDVAIVIDTSYSMGYVTGKETVLDSRVCDCCQTSLIATASGELMATYRDRSADEVRDISLVRFDGKQWSEPKLVHADEWLIDGCPVNGPRVVSTDGLSAVTWFTGVGGGGGSVRLAFRKDDWYGAPIDIDEGKPVGRVDLVFLPAETALVSWMEYAEAGEADWRVRTVSQAGKLGASIKVGRVPSDRASGYLRMVPSEDAVVLTWTTPGPEGQIETARLRPRK